MNIHLDYGLKGTSYWSKGGLGNDALSCVNFTCIPPYPYPTIRDLTEYTFKDGITEPISITSTNVFKKNPGIGGLVSIGGAAQADKTVQIYLGTKLYGTTTTDADGWYMWQY